MPRTTDAAVRAITTVPKKVTDLTPYIEVANNMVTRVCLESDYDDATLELIERYLAAHFLAVHFPISIMERAASVQSLKEHKVALGLMNTRYGQQACMIDTAGNLAAVSANAEKGIKKVQVGLTYLGKVPCSVQSGDDC